MTNLFAEYARAARKAAQEVQARKYQDEIERCRRDRNFFCEWCFQDHATGRQITQARHHRDWQSLTSKNRRLVVWYPIEHGKTTQAKMALCWLLGTHPDRQYAYISSKQNQANKMIAAVKREIETNHRLRLVFPDLKPQMSALSKSLEEWGNTRIRVHGCPPGSRDPSLAAYGLDGQILGSRLHGAILDNILDKKNTRSRALREWVLEVIEDEIIGRIMEGGFIWVLDTAWFEDDALHQLANKPGWTAVKHDAETPLVEGAETLWPEQWPKERLMRRKKELGATAFDRQFRNRPLGESMNFFRKEYWGRSYGRCPWLEAWPDGFDPQVEVRTGVDLATRKGETNDLTVMTTVIARGVRRQVVNIRAERMVATEILRAMIEIYRALHRPVNLGGGNARFVVEDNAAQVYIVQLLQDAGTLQSLGMTLDEATDIRVVGRTTTAKRRDLELGIPAIASGMEMDRWDFPAHPEVRALWDEMKVWSPDIDHYGDRLMSLWFAAADLQETGGGWSVMIAE